MNNSFELSNPFGSFKWLNVRSRLASSVILCAATLALLQARGADSKSKSGFTEGPGKARLEKVAELDVPEGYIFIDGKTTRALMKKAGEPTSGDEYGSLMPTNESFTVMFEYNDIGYVKDDDKDNLNADKLLDAYKRGTAEANKQRVRADIPPLEIVGWELPPRYDATTHNLEWAIRATSAGQPILNYNTKLLGRKGVMEVILIVEPEKLNETLPTFRNLIAGYSFQTGLTYAEYRPGDKVAKYGLAALVVGGAAVGAAKLGMFAWLAVVLKKAWKLVIVAVAAVAAFIKKTFRRLFGRGEATTGSE
jgi:uncharacterized membrane-anchored protein